MEVAEVKNHKRNFEGGFIKHSADVKILGQLTRNIDLASQTSRAVGYHTGGYGLYEFSVEKISTDEFHVEWETSDSCD